MHNAHFLEKYGKFMAAIGKFIDLVETLLFRHGCPKCTAGMQSHPQIKNNTYAQLYAETQHRENVFKRNGHTSYEGIWECEIYEELNKNKEMREFFKTVFHTRRLLPRVGLLEN